jgi:hypothetical protein
MAVQEVGCDDVEVTELDESKVLCYSNMKLARDFQKP